MRLLDEVPGWEAFAVGALVWILSFAVVTAIGWIVALALPVDYFLPGPSREPGARRGAAALERWAVRAGRNVLGLALVAAGATMLLTPGPGLAALVLGLVLVDAPGKKALLRRATKHAAVQRALNRLRRRWGRAPFRFEDDEESGDGPSPATEEAS